MDIDSYDIDVILAILHKRSPDFIFVEINEKVPPPICYCNRFSHTWSRLNGGAYGCSLGFSQISGIATYSSYRDPNLKQTLDNYDGAAAWLDDPGGRGQRGGPHPRGRGAGARAARRGASAGARRRRAGARARAGREGRDLSYAELYYA